MIIKPLTIDLYHRALEGNETEIAAMAIIVIIMVETPLHQIKDDLSKSRRHHPVAKTHIISNSVSKPSKKISKNEVKLQAFLWGLGPPRG